MSPILGIWASQNYSRYSLPTSFDSIATTTVGAGGASSITFSSIPSTYTHLQVRISARSSANDDFRFRLNGDTGANYSRHFMYSNGPSVLVGSATSSTLGNVGGIDNTANSFTVAIMDILDYTNTNKFTTVRILNGYSDTNKTVRLASTAWLNTSAVTSITLFPDTSNFQQYSHFALYGIKGA